MIVAVLVVGALVVVVALALVVRANPGASDAVLGLAHIRPRQPPRRRPPELQSWEADILAATTGGRRGRVRLAGRIEPLVSSLLRDNHGLALTDDAAVEVLGPEWDFLNGLPPARPDMDVETAVGTLLDRLVQSRPVAGA